MKRENKKGKGKEKDKHRHKVRRAREERLKKNPTAIPVSGVMANGDHFNAIAKIQNIGGDWGDRFKCKQDGEGDHQRDNEDNEGDHGVSAIGSSSTR